MTFVTAVMVNYRTEDLLPVVVGGLLTNESLAKIVIVDNSDSVRPGQLPGDRSKVISGRHIQSRRYFPYSRFPSFVHGAALNLGLRHSQTEMTLILDPDMFVFPYTVDSLIQLLRAKGLEFIGAPRPRARIQAKGSKTTFDYPSVLFVLGPTAQLSRIDMQPKLKVQFPSRFLFDLSDDTGCRLRSHLYTHNLPHELLTISSELLPPFDYPGASASDLYLYKGQPICHHLRGGAQDRRSLVHSRYDEVVSAWLRACEQVLQTCSQTTLPGESSRCKHDLQSYTTGSFASATQSPHQTASDET